MEHAEALPEPPYALRKATEEEGAEVRQLLSPETMGRNLGLLLTLSPEGRGEGQLSSQGLDHLLPMQKCSAQTLYEDY